MFSLDGYQALRHGAAVVRRGDRGILTVSGADRLSWLQGLLTNDVLALPIGGVCDAAYLTPQGRMLADLRVMNLADRVLLDVPGSLTESLRARLDALLFAEDAQIADDSRRLTLVDVHGPRALSDDVLSAVRAAGTDIVSDAAFGVPGVSIVSPAGDADRIVKMLGDAGATEIALDTLDVLRVEAGRPAFLVDMDEHTIPLEAGIEARAISFTKGCYVGQEVIVRVMHRGQGRVAKKLVGFLFEKGRLAKGGDAIRSGDREIGRVTSAVWSPAMGCGIGLGYVHRDFIDAGTPVTVLSSDGSLAATVSALPFVPATEAVVP